MKNIFRATRELLAAPPTSVLRGKHTKLNPKKLEQIQHDFGEEFDAPQLDRELVRELFMHGERIGYANDRTDEYALDRWLAPRLHSAIRLSRRVASDRAFWAWIAMSFAPEYVFRRWSDGDGRIRTYRFTGDLLRNGVSRLWWAAELLRNGPDYSNMHLGLRRASTAQSALELKYSWYRPAVIAFVNVAEGGSRKASDSQLRALEKRANAYLPLAPLEAIGFDDAESDHDESWWEDAATLKELTGPDEPQGPKDGYADANAIRALERWFSDVLGETDGVSGDE